MRLKMIWTRLRKPLPVQNNNRQYKATIMTHIIKKLLPGLLLVLTVLLHAQTDVSNTGTLAIGTSGSLYVTGSFNNTATAAFNNNGSLYVQQGLSNAQAAMTAGGGTLYLNGSILQTLSGPQPFSTFNLFTSNAAGIQLNNDLNVSGLHTFVAGIITTDGVPHHLIYQDGASYTGYADIRHVNGWVRKAGNADFIFPLGNGTVQRPLAISNLSAVSVFDATYPGPTFNTGSISAPLATINLNEYWRINKISGGTADMDLSWDNSKKAIPPYVLTDMRVAGFIGGSWISLGGTASGNIATTGIVHASSLASFGALTIGSISFALPVTIIQFSATAGSNGNNVNWITADEINVGYYDLQRSDDGISFYNIVNVAAQNGTGTQQYQFTDSKPMLQSSAWYRLRSVDKDGQTKLSKVVVVTGSNNRGAILYAINPVHDRIELQVQRISGALRYNINTLSGQTVQQGVLTIGLPGRYSIQLSPVVAHGVYILQLEKPGFVFTQRLLVD